MPEAAHAVRGQVVDKNGAAVTNAEILLIEPVDDSIPYKSYHLTIRDGQVRNPIDHVLTTSNAQGAFTVYPSTENVKHYLLALHPQSGFALVKREGQSPTAPIKLKPWASVTGKVLPQQGFEQSASISTTVQEVDGWPEVSISQHAEEQKAKLPKGVFVFNSIPPNLASFVRRSLKKPEGGSLELPTRKIELEPGESATVLIGEFSDEERTHLELHERLNQGN